MKILTDLQVDIKDREVLRLQGYKRKGAQPINMVKEVLEDAVKKGYNLVEPRAVYTYVKVKDMEGGSLVLEGGLRLSLGSGISVWEKAEYLAVALCTIGLPLEERVSELFSEGDYAAALMLDSVGSVAVGSVADRVNHFICQRANRLHIRVGPRLSPGYGKWDLRDQRVLFALLPGEKVGVGLNENFMMIPRKSISFCVGMGQGVGGDRMINPCRHCGMEDCKYRRTVL